MHVALPAGRLAAATALRPCFLLLVLLVLVLRWRPGRPSASPPIPGIMAVCTSRALMYTTVLLLLSVQPPGYSAEETVAAAQARRVTFSLSVSQTRRCWAAA